MSEDHLPSTGKSDAPAAATAANQDLERIAEILAAAGEENPLDVLMPLVHQDLRRLARSQRRRLHPGETLSTTVLVNEAYLKLRGVNYPGLEGPAHFFSLVARAMRQILIDHARSRLAEHKRMLEVKRDLDERPFEDAEDLARLIEVDSALSELERHHPRLAQVVLYRYFAGYSPAEIGELLGIHLRTVNRDWHRARAWLLMALDHQQSAADG